MLSSGSKCSNSPVEQCVDPGPCAYVSRVSGEIVDGSAVCVNAKIIKHGKYFTIDFCLDNEDNDIALRLHGCVSTNSLTRNSRINGKWSVEEIDLSNDIRIVPAMTLWFKVQFLEGKISIALNRKHIAYYVQRLPFNRVRSVKICGHIAKARIRIKDNSSRSSSSAAVNKSRVVQILEDIYLGTGAISGMLSVDKFLPLPYHFLLNAKFFVAGNGLVIKGIATPNANRIIIALQKGHAVSPQPLKAIQIEIRFQEHLPNQPNKPMIAFNTFTGDRWTGEIVSHWPSGLRPGENFDLLIGWDRKKYSIYVNGTHICSYPHQIPSKRADTCFIYGDIQLIEIRYKNM